MTNASQTPEQPPEAPPVHSARFDTINPVLLRKSKITAWLLAGASTLLAAAVAAGLVFGLALPLNSSGRSAAAWIEHTLEVITAVKDLQVAADDIETGQRGFLLTRNPSYLGPYDQAAKVIWHQYSSIRDLVGDNPSQIQNLNTLSDDLRDKMAELDRTIGLARGGDFDRAIEVARTGEGKRLMDDLRTVVRDMTAEEQRLLKVRRVQVEQSDRRSRLAFILLAALAISGFCLSSVIVVRRRMVAAAEKQAAGAQVLRQRLLDMVNVAAVMVRDGDGTILFWSEGCRRLYGWTAEQAVGRSAVDLLKSVFPGSYTPIENELLGSGTWHGELRQRRQDNVEITVSVSKALHNYEDGSGSVVMENMIDVSALRDVERELLTSEAQFHALVDTAADAFVIADAEGRIEFVNAAGLRMFGYGQSSELIGRSLDVMMTATDAARHDGYIAVRRDGAGAVGLDGRELLAVRRDGSKFPIEISVSSFDINGSHRLTGIIRDTTVRKRAEEALRDSEARLRLVQEVGGIAYFDRKEPESASVISAETACMYGLPPTQARMSPEEWLARIHPEDRSRMADERNRLLEHGGIWTAEFRICRGDGAVRSVAMRAGVFPETDGGPPRLIAAQQDITDMVAARQVLALHRQDLEQQVTERTAALAEAEARFRGIFDSQFQFISLLAPDGTTLEMNRTALDAAALSRDDAIGKPFWETGWWPAAERDQVRREVADAASGVFIRRDVEIKDARGQSIWIDFSLKPVRDPVTDAPLWIIAESRDLTEKRNIAAQLAQSQKVEALGQLAGGIAHDFNNILQAVSGAAALIERRPEDHDRTRRLAQTAITAADRGASITQRLLSFARRSELCAEALATATLLNNMSELLARTLGTTIIVRTDVSPDVPALVADQAQLETVIVNLGTNARDAMPDGGSLTLSAAAEHVGKGDHHPVGLASGDYVRLSVVDNGTGIDAATLARVTEPFFTTKPHGQGTGLGLSMAKGFAEQSGGALSITSVLGKGTTVMMWLRQAGTDVVQTHDVEPGRQRRVGISERILVVDDDDLVREMVAGELESEGFATLVASGGLEAIALLEAGEIVDAMVSDLSMPGMNGLTTISKARALRPRLPCFLLTGYAGERAALSAENAFTLVRKPVTGRALAIQIEAVLQGVNK